MQQVKKPDVAWVLLTQAFGPANDVLFLKAFYNELGWVVRSAVIHTLASSTFLVYWVVVVLISLMFKEMRPWVSFLLLLLGGLVGVLHRVSSEEYLFAVMRLGLSKRIHKDLQGRTLFPQDIVWINEVIWNLSNHQDAPASLRWKYRRKIKATLKAVRASTTTGLPNTLLFKLLSDRFPE